MSASSDFWIMQPFNKLFFIVLAAFLLLLAVAGLLLRGKSEKLKRGVLVAVCLVTFVGFFFYKYYLSIDAEYNVLTADKGGFNWWGELPLHLCNINMMLIPIAVLRKSRPLMCFSFFLAPLGAFMALAMPGAGFSDCSLLLPRMLGYYGTHFMIEIEGLALAVFGLYRPKFSDLPRAVLAALLISLLIFTINLIMRYTGVHPNANYFYSVETEGNQILELFHKWIPVPYLYLLPAILILLPYMLIVTTPFAIADAIRKKRRSDLDF